MKKQFRDQPLPPIDILVVTYNARQKVARCIRSVIRHTQGVNYRLAVIDNASSDGTVEYLDENFAQKIDLIKSPQNLGFSGGANLLLRRTSRPWVALLDDDVEVTPGWIEKLYKLAKKIPDVGIVGGKVVYPNGKIFCAEFCITPFGSAGHGEPDRGQRNYTKEVDALPGPCWLMPRSVIEKVGPFDENFFPCQCEDIDYCLRVRQAGYKVVYYGKVKIVHHNLFRNGSHELLNTNFIKFFKKWRKVLKRFPLVPLNANDTMMVEGARLLCKETFCPVYPVLGKVAILNRWFSEPLYRGILYWASGHFGKAAAEFRRVLVLARDTRANISQQDCVSYQVLSVYFFRLGLLKEARRCGERAMSIAAQATSRVLDVPKRAVKKQMRLHRWQIRISAEETRYLGILKRFLPYYRMQTHPPKLRRGQRLLEIYASTLHGKPGTMMFSERQLAVYDAPEVGIYRTFGMSKDRIFIALDPNRIWEENTIFHGAFLWPLALLLRFQGASLVHGALLQKNSKGILILGEKGAGKSTLTTACLQQGFRYFSDEHPILELKASHVVGKNFINKIALPAVSVKSNFAKLESKMTWSFERQKYILDPLKIWPGCMGETSTISRVIFPKFKRCGKLSVKRMSQDSLFERLLEDEYLGGLLQNGKKNPERFVPWRIANLLSKTTCGYTIEYAASDILRMPAMFEEI